jgi:predicted ABC-type transport system involved in lysophospholipase L1 biosynthesis ATPase subunit
VHGLRVAGLSKGYSRGDGWVEVLNAVSFEVAPGEIAALIGARSTGKTALLEIVAGMERADGGAVYLGDLELTNMRERARARLLGRRIIWLDPHGPGLDVEVSRFVGWSLAIHGKKGKAVKRRAAQMLERVGACQCVGRRWGELSNAERALAGLARAFAGSPDLVIIDDLLNGLSGRITEEVSDLLRSLVEESERPSAVLMSASDMESAMFANRVWSFTRKGTLKLMAGRPTEEGAVIPFLRKDEREGSHNVGVS